MTIASGDARAASVMSSASCSSASGDVHVGAAAADVEIGSASGSISIDRFDGAEVSVKTMSGDVMLGLPAGIRVEPDISTLSGRTSLPSPAPAASDGPRRLVRVGLRTVSGDITVRRVDGG